MMGTGASRPSPCPAGCGGRGGCGPCPSPGLRGTHRGSPSRAPAGGGGVAAAVWRAPRQVANLRSLGWNVDVLAPAPGLGSSRSRAAPSPEPAAAGSAPCPAWHRTGAEPCPRSRSPGGHRGRSSSRPAAAPGTGWGEGERGPVPPVAVFVLAGHGQAPRAGGGTQTPSLSAACLPPPRLPVLMGSSHLGKGTGLRGRLLENPAVWKEWLRAAPARSWGHGQRGLGGQAAPLKPGGGQQHPTCGVAAAWGARRGRRCGMGGGRGAGGGWRGAHVRRSHPSPPRAVPAVTWGRPPQ